MRETELQVFILNILHRSALFLSSWDAQGPGIIILITIPPLRSAPGPGGQEIFRSSATKHPWREKERSRLLLRPFPPPCLHPAPHVRGAFGRMGIKERAGGGHGAGGDPWPPPASAVGSWRLWERAAHLDFLIPAAPLASWGQHRPVSPRYCRDKVTPCFRNPTVGSKFCKICQILPVCIFPPLLEGAGAFLEAPTPRFGCKR